MLWVIPGVEGVAYTGYQPRVTRLLVYPVWEPGGGLSLAEGWRGPRNPGWLTTAEADALARELGRRGDILAGRVRETVAQVSDGRKP